MLNDALTISRYIQSCKTLRQLQVCDNILWRFKLKYGKTKKITDRIKPYYMDYLEYFKAISNDIQDKKLEIIGLTDKEDE